MKKKFDFKQNDWNRTLTTAAADNLSIVCFPFKLKSP
ncbi:hypothetical protein T01_5242 [Trichinella spiralis]|uniref:Uncharacterized protein n=1 Tax=Trichinella spiralis TaxID=6334 RepID=A0A0V1AIH7_TRISP|nr:hypothetical protein T01_8002 [Trichinella spiralis]KRY24614.1 hypothetical protein T01_5242 [Trichinella spiralis]